MIWAPTFSIPLVSKDPRKFPMRSPLFSTTCNIEFTLQGTNISHPVKRTNHFQTCLGWGYVIVPRGLEIWEECSVLHSKLIFSLIGTALCDLASMGWHAGGQHWWGLGFLPGATKPPFLACKQLFYIVLYTPFFFWSSLYWCWVLELDQSKGWRNPNKKTCHLFAESHREDSPVVGTCTSGAAKGLENWMIGWLDVWCWRSQEISKKSMVECFIWRLGEGT